MPRSVQKLCVRYWALVKTIIDLIVSGGDVILETYDVICGLEVVSSLLELYLVLNKQVLM